MLEENKTYSWADFWKYCKIGETYKITITEDISSDEAIPILNEKETYFYYPSGHFFEIPRFYAATEFITAFKRLLGKHTKEVIGSDWYWYDSASYYECGKHDDHYQITIYTDTIHQLMQMYGVEEEDREVFEQEYLAKLPNIKEIYSEDRVTILDVDLEECDYFGYCGDYTITVKAKGDDWKFEVEGSGYASGDDADFWGLMDHVEVVVNRIL